MLRRLIAHQIIKGQLSSTAELHLRVMGLPTESDLSGTLLQELREGFQRRNPFSGSFKSTGATQPRLQQMLLRYLEQDSQESGFVSLTRDAMEVLKEEMITEPLSTGGYVVFAEYDFNDVPFLLIALLSTTANPTFDPELNLVASTSLDLDHLRHAARIRLLDVAENSPGVVQFISQRQDGVSEYFVNFIGCDAVARPSVQGNRLYTALEAWATDSHLEEQDKWELLGEAHSHWQQRRLEGRPMTLTALANDLNPDDPEPLLRHLAREDFQLAGEFSPPPPSVMKRFIRFSFHSGGLRLDFDRTRWENRISVNRENRTLTIRDVPEDLIAAIEERA